jgi:hypothetical protein
MNKKEHHQAFRLIKNLFILVILFFIVDRLLGLWLQHRFKTVPQGDIKTFAHSITNPTEYIYIYGSSRALHGYDCSEFTKILGYTCFNNGKQNSTILYHNLILNEMLKKHVPKIIILDFAPKELSWSESNNSKTVLANMILPYTIHDTAFANIAKAQFPEEYYKAQLSRLYAYKESVPAMFNTRNTGNKGEKEINGYRPLYGSKVKNTPMNYGNETEQPDSSAEQAFDTFIQTIADKHIRLFVIQSPIFVRQYESTPSIDYAKSVLKKYNIPFWDFAFDTTLYRHEYFYDYIHLNAEGARIFSEKVAKRIKQVEDSVNTHLR